MKNLRKLFAIVLSLIILLTVTLPVQAVSPSSSAAAKCEALGVLIGAGSGVTAQYLSMATTRAQGATLLLRLMGKEDEAKAYAGKANFSDVVGNEWFAPLLAYLKANPNLGFDGYPDGTFRPNKIMTVAEFNKVLMTCLGFRQDVDYIWANVMNYARNLGLLSFSDGSKSLINNDIAMLIIDALAIRKKGVDETLVEFLIAQGVINAVVADSIGLISRMTIVSAEATNDNEITVNFNKAIPAGTVATIKSGTATIFTTQTWSTDRTKLVLTKSSPFITGNYVVTVGNLTPANVTVQAGIASQIELSGNTILKNAAAPITVTLYNQYGKNMNVNARSAYTITAFNKTKGGAVFVNAATFTMNTDAADEGDTIHITIVHNASTVVGQFDLTVIKQPVVTTFSMTEIVVPNNQMNIEKNNKKVVVKYEAYDQYGNALILKSKDGLTFVTSNPAIIDSNTVAFDNNGVMTVDIGNTSGSVNLSALVNAAASVTSLTINVYDPVGIASIEIYYANGSVYVGESTAMQYNVFDQYKSSVSKTLNSATITANLTFTSSNTSIIKNSDFSVDSNGVLSVKPTGGQSGSVVVYYSWSGKFIDTFTLDVNEAAAPTSVTNMNYMRGIELGAEHRVPISDITVVDQYGRTLNAATHGLTVDDFKITGDSNTITVVKDPTGYLVFSAGATEGVVTFTLGVNFGGEFLPNSTRTFSMRAYDVNSVANNIRFSFEPFSTLYSNTGFVDLAAAGDYAKPVKVYGIAPDGTNIALKQDKISHLVSSNSSILVVQDGITFKLFSKSSNASDTSTVRAYDSSAKLLCEMEVKSSNARSIKSLSFGSDFTTTSLELNGKNVATFNKFNFKIMDQYDVNMLATIVPVPINLSATGFFTSSNTNILTVDSSGNLTVKSTGTVTLTFTSITGMQDSIKITIN